MDNGIDLIVSVHIPKTGGLSFYDALYYMAGKQLLLDYEDRLLEPRRVRRVLRERLRKRDLPEGTRIVHGHFRASKYRHLYPEARIVTWLRDPVQRVVSHYHYWLREPDPASITCKRLHDEKLSLLEFAALKEMRDVQSRFIDRVPLTAIDFIGFTETYEKDMKRFGLLFAPERQLPVMHVNANPNRGKRYELTPDDQEEIEWLNWKDMDLYVKARILTAPRLVW